MSDIERLNCDHAGYVRQARQYLKVLRRELLTMAMQVRMSKRAIEESRKLIERFDGTSGAPDQPLE